MDPACLQPKEQPVRTFIASLFAVCSGYCFGTVMIEATATTLRFLPTSNSGPWWLTELKSPASKWHPLRSLFQFKKQAFQWIPKVPMKIHGITKLHLIWRLKTFWWSFSSVLTIKYLNENLRYMTKQAFRILWFKLDLRKWHVVKQVKKDTILSCIFPPHPTLPFRTFRKFCWCSTHFSNYSGTLSYSPPSWHSQG